MRKTRGKGIVPAMVHANLRLPVETMEFYQQYEKPTQAMRDVLIAYAKRKQQ
jgi:hypothetical protein